MVNTAGANQIINLLVDDMKILACLNIALFIEVRVSLSPGVHPWGRVL